MPQEKRKFIDLSLNDTEIQELDLEMQKNHHKKRATFIKWIVQRYLVMVKRGEG